MAALACLTLVPPAFAASNEPPDVVLPRVEVVAGTPLPEIESALPDAPANVHTLSADVFGAMSGAPLTDRLERRLPGASVSSSQGNPQQAELLYRGFGASPILGVPQGLSVYLDGVRINEVFGDTVNWDLLPSQAIARMQMLPGSNPVFGLNTLGGALVAQTKSGRTHPGYRLGAGAGSFRHGEAQAEIGGAHGDADYYLAADTVDERGWRRHSSSRLRRAFAKLGVETADSDVDVSVIAADTTLSGTQALPASMQEDPAQPYTWPDRTGNRLFMTTLQWSHSPTADMLLAGNLYFRRLRTADVSSNIKEDFDPALPLGAPLAAPDDASRPLNYPATNDEHRSVQTSGGAAGQVSLRHALLGVPTRWSLGASVAAGVTDYRQAFEYATLTDDRGTRNAAAAIADTDLRARNLYAGAYFLGVAALTDRLRLTLSGRYNFVAIRLGDRSGVEPRLNGSHRYRRFNPAAGVTFTPHPGHTLFASYSEGMRAPSPVELSCADAGAPCRLPNAFLSDPPLKPVVSRTWELGVRGAVGEVLSWSGALFRTALRDDIQFVAAGGSAVAGFFRNVERTRRSGVELALDWDPGRWSFDARYARVDAVFDSAFALPGPHNARADAAGDIRVERGDRIPDVPRDQFGLGVRYAWSDATRIGADMLAVSRRVARGNENNRDPAGYVGGYALFNLEATRRVARGIEFIARVRNVFDRRHASFGVLGSNVFAGPGNAFTPGAGRDELFTTPGEPRSLWIGVGITGGR